MLQKLRKLSFLKFLLNLQNHFCSLQTFETTSRYIPCLQHDGASVLPALLRASHCNWGNACLFSPFFYEHLQAYMYIHMYHMYSCIPQRYMCGCGISVVIFMVIIKSCNSVSQQLFHQCIMDTPHVNILDIIKNI